MTIDPSSVPPMLAVETSTAVCAVAAVAGGEIFEDTRYLERLHNQQVLTMVDAVTAQVQQRLGQAFTGYSLVAFGRGPGSFTGVRIGAALTQAVAYAHNAQILALPSLQILVTSVLPPQGLAAEWDTAQQGSRCCVGFVRSRQQAYYVQAFELALPDAATNVATACWQPLAAPALVDGANEFSAWRADVCAAAKVTGVGQQPPWFGDQGAVGAEPRDYAWVTASTELASQAQLAGQSAAQISANGLVDVCLQHYQLDRMQAVASALPEYLAADSPWQTTRERKALQGSPPSAH